jgi:hypothetical protein
VSFKEWESRPSPTPIYVSLRYPYKRREKDLYAARLSRSLALRRHLSASDMSNCPPWRLLCNTTSSVGRNIVSLVNSPYWLPFSITTSSPNNNIRIPWHFFCPLLVSTARLLLTALLSRCQNESKSVASALKHTLGVQQPGDLGFGLFDQLGRLQLSPIQLFGSVVDSSRS